MTPTYADHPAPHVLVAEDEPNVATLIEECLTDEGYRVTLAGDGVEAVEALPRGDFDLLLTDVRMPRLDGVGLIRHVRAARPAMPIVVLSGYMTPEARTELRRLGVPNERVLEKPLPFPELHGAIRRALRAAAQEIAARRASGGEHGPEEE